jgi:hypothetical protein
VRLWEWKAVRHGRILGFRLGYRAESVIGKVHFRVTFYNYNAYFVQHIFTGLLPLRMNDHLGEKLKLTKGFTGKRVINIMYISGPNSRNNVYA